MYLVNGTSISISLRIAILYLFFLSYLHSKDYIKGVKTFFWILVLYMMYRWQKMSPLSNSKYFCYLYFWFTYITLGFIKSKMLPDAVEFKYFRFYPGHRSMIIIGLRYGGSTSFWKIWNRHFFQDIQNSFKWATGTGLEPNQIFFQKKIQQIRSLELSKVLAKMGRAKQADWETAKILMPI